MTGKAQETKALPIYVVNTDDAQGIVEAIVNVFGILDLGKDVIVNGAYTKTLNERGNQVKVRVKVLDSHNTDSVLRVIGKPLEIREVGREELARLAPQVLIDHPDATGGLYTKTQYALDVPEGLGAYKRIAGDYVNEYSIALDALDVEYGTFTTPEGKTIAGVRFIKSIRLWEYSPVVFGMNQATVTVDVKAASGRTDLPLAARDRAWDATEAEKTVRAWAGGDDPDWSKYGQAFFWHADDPSKPGDFKLGFAEVIDDTLTAIPRGIFAVAAVLEGSRGGVEGISDDELSAIRGKVETYYAKMADEFDDDTLVPPWKKNALAAAETAKQATLGAMLEARLRMSYAYCVNGWLAWGTIDTATVDVLDTALKDGLAAFRAAVPAELLGTALTEYYRRPAQNERKQATLGASLEADLRNEFAWTVNDWYADGTIDAATLDSLNAALSVFMGVFRAALPADLSALPLPTYYYAAAGSREQKAGRMISARNMQIIQDAIDALQALLDAAAAESNTSDSSDAETEGADKAQPQAGPSGMVMPSAASPTTKAEIELELAQLAILQEMIA